jgi:DNA polymerase-3 subunit epsilon
LPIPEQATAVHGISNEMVKDAPVFKQVANEIAQFLEGCDLAGYNSNRFDIPMLVESFLRAGIEWKIDSCKLLDVQKIFHQMEQRTLSAAYKFYCQKELEGAHSAEVDASATWEILKSQLQRYPQLGQSLDSILQVIGEEKIVDYARRFVFENGVEVFNFGKHKGRTVEDVLRTEPQYYDWMMKGDFALHTKHKLTEILNRTLLKRK